MPSRVSHQRPHLGCRSITKELSILIGYWEEILDSDWLLGPLWAVGRSHRIWSFPDIAKTTYIDKRGG